MARLLHLSDLHFGAHDPVVVEALERQVDEEKPDLVVISGDFTQRARTEQFEEACKFLERLRDAGHDVLAVPGNHDVPLYDVLRRFLSPLTRYKRFIDETLCPYHELKGVSLLGINTARSLTFSEGRISHEQMEFIRRSFERSDPNSIRILVTHHPLFALPVGDTGEVKSAVGRHELALDAVADAGVDMLLAGHHHTASTHSARDLVTRAGPALVVQAGTATSIRLRDEKQSFNRIEIAGDLVTITLQAWTGDRFEPQTSQRYEREDEQWRVVGAEKELDQPAH
ncbi:metallophosphoesterase [Sphingomonas sp. SM33]|uniref:Metallophosphoesterase n=1 Tax=Sphingomonas telluris TaxID=2907998 RepID=A0ABS9VL72_9SPHN|nr:metallophosphoesterase [Sphingomonas telluris]MCH8615717.1 metallophosphoesterase [Sphingomonas telluris]